MRTWVRTLSILAFVAGGIGCTPSEEERDAFKDAVRGGRVADVEKLARATPKLVDAQLGKKKGSVALHYAITAHDPRLVDALLKLGADPNITDERGNTHLHSVAYASCNREMAASLLANGADATRRNAKGQTALDVAEFYEGKCSHLAELLRGGD